MSREEKAVSKSGAQLMRAGVIVLVLAGRHAGRKAVIIKSYDEGSTGKSYGHALIVGIDRYPRKIIRRMGKKRREARCKVKPFYGLVNYNHLMPTRYSINIDFNREIVNKASVLDKAKRHKLMVELRAKMLNK